MSGSSSRERADKALVGRGVFESRAKAREAIEAGLVSVDGVLLRKASESIPLGANVQATAPYPWVSRGGVKLAAALDLFGFDCQGRICLDVGASTGGFTDVLTSRGARKVYAVDVGHGQFHEKLRADRRVVVIEGTDARHLTGPMFDEPPSLITCDASFISLRLVLPPVVALAAQSANLVALIKPQFEAGRGLVKRGIVRDSGVHARVCAEISSLVSDLGWRVLAIVPSPIEGGEGNREFLLGASR